MKHRNNLGNPLTYKKISIKSSFLKLEPFILVAEPIIENDKEAEGCEYDDYDCFYPGAMMNEDDCQEALSGDVSKTKCKAPARSKRGAIN